jgi:calcineurin-like phosphoesterase family protein
MIYFTSDLHFGHESIIKFCNRPFGSVEAMNKALINNWNTTVGYEDEIYILGDFTNDIGKAKRYLPALNGKKYMIAGNHDKWLNTPEETNFYFEWVKEYAVINGKGFKWVLFHYPLAEWAGFYSGSIHLHGHVHNRQISKSWNNSIVRAFNVGVDVNDYKPISIDALIRRANKISVEKRNSNASDIEFDQMLD